MHNIDYTESLKAIIRFICKASVFILLPAMLPVAIIGWAFDSYDTFEDLVYKSIAPSAIFWILFYMFGR